MFEQVLPATTRIQLVELSKITDITKCYLAGGTGLALQLGHRKSYDLDFFTNQEFNAERLSERLRNLFKDFSVDRVDWGTILGNLGEIKFSLFFYKYPVLKDGEVWEGVRVASLEDIAAMKLHAISDRGARRDFVDMFYLLKQFSFEQVCEFYDQKYANWSDQKYHIMRSLIYFEIAESEPELEMLMSDYDWDGVKQSFVNLAKSLTI